MSAGFRLEDALENTHQDLAQEVKVEMLAVESISGVSQYFQFIPYILLNVILLALGPIFVIFKGSDLAKRMECSALMMKEKKASSFLLV